MNRTHVQMVFRFSGLTRAYAFAVRLKELGVSGEPSYSPALGWHVETDSRCLEHAAKLLPLLYGGKQS